MIKEICNLANWLLIHSSLMSHQVSALIFSSWKSIVMGPFFKQIKRRSGGLEHPRRGMICKSSDDWTRCCRKNYDSMYLDSMYLMFQYSCFNTKLGQHARISKSILSPSVFWQISWYYQLSFTLFQILIFTSCRAEKRHA